MATSANSSRRTRLARPAPASDERMNALLDELFVVTTRLAQAPDRDANDLSLKLDVLCRRLREDVVPENPGDVLTYLLDGFDPHG